MSIGRLISNVRHIAALEVAASLLKRQLYLVILVAMKTAISLPDGTFQRIEREAKRRGLSRSEFFTKAAVRYLDELDAESLTRQINQVIDSQGQSDDSTVDAVNAGHRLLAGMDEGW